MDKGSGIEGGSGEGCEPIALRLRRSVSSFLILQESAGLPLLAVLAEILWSSALIESRQQQLGLLDLSGPPVTT